MQATVITRALATCVFLVMAVNAMAHRAPGSQTMIEFNPNSGMTEIVHRLHLHDAELGVAMAIDEPALQVAELQGRAQVALYVDEHFSISSGVRTLPLATVGAEIAGNYLLVYQEFDGRLPAEILISNDILYDAFPEQVNEVHIDDAGTVHTLTFAGKDRALPFRLAVQASIADGG